MISSGPWTSGEGSSIIVLSMASIPSGIPPSPPPSSEGEVSPQHTIDGTVYPPVYSVASSDLGAVKVLGEELGDTVPSSMVFSQTHSPPEVYQIS